MAAKRSGFYPLARLPRSVLGLMKEVARHLLRRPVVGLSVFARDPEGRVLLIRRADTGTWALPGGTVEWGETLRQTLAREMAEETGIDEVEFRRVVGVWSRPDRDPRFHAVTIVVEAGIGPIVRPPLNGLEILEARFFAPEEIPSEFAMTMRDYLDAALAGASDTGPGQRPAVTFE
jgi:8-oxo-dGTP diphosphatase